MGHVAGELTWDADVEADVRCRADCLVHVRGGRVVEPGTHADIVVGQEAGIVDRVMAVADRLWQHFSALRECPHGEHVRSDAIREL